MYKLHSLKQSRKWNKGPWKTIFLYKGLLVSFHDCWREGIYTFVLSQTLGITHHDQRPLRPPAQVANSHWGSVLLTSRKSEARKPKKKIRVNQTSVFRHEGRTVPVEAVPVRFTRRNVVSGRKRTVRGHILFECCWRVREAP